MKKTGLQDNDDDMILSIKNNLANRNNNLISFLTMLENIDENYVIAIDGDWGSGKTFFVKQLMKIIDFKQGNLPSDEIAKMGNILAIEKQLNRKYTTIYYNAWDYDDTDPMLSLLYCLCNNKNFEKSKGTLKKIVSIADCLPIPLIGGHIQTITDAFTKENLTEIVEKNKNLREDISKLLVDILSANSSDNNPNSSDKIVIFVDELDRCNPIFAVKMLEKIKHIFTDDRFIFVFSTTLTQLSHTVCNYYGQNFDSYLYLEKMFDTIVNLNKCVLDEYFGSFCNQNYIVFYDIAREIATYYNFSLRQCNKYIQEIKMLEKSLNDLYSGSDHFKSILIVVLLGIKQNNIWNYSNTLNGSNPNTLKDVIEKCPYIKENIDRLILNIDRSINIDSTTYVNIYNFFFNYRSEDKLFGILENYDEKQITNVLSMLSNKSNYQLI